MATELWIMRVAGCLLFNPTVDGTLVALHLPVRNVPDYFFDIQSGEANDTNLILLSFIEKISWKNAMIKL